MNNPETHGSVQQLARDGEALPTVALPTEVSAPLGVVRLAELRRDADRALSKARQTRRCIWSTSSSIYWQCRGEEAALAKVVKYIARKQRASRTIASELS